MSSKTIDRSEEIRAMRERTATLSPTTVIAALTSVDYCFGQVDGKFAVSKGDVDQFMISPGSDRLLLEAWRDDIRDYVMNIRDAGENFRLEYDVNPGQVEQLQALIGLV